jgi:acyl-CoA thioesterase
MEPFIKQQLLTFFLEKSDPQRFDHLYAPEILSLELGFAKVKWVPTEIFLNRLQSIHGGALAGLADIVGSLATLTYGKKVVTTDLNISYLKAGQLSNTFLMTGKVVHAGRSMMRTEVECFNEFQQTIIRAQLSFFVLGPWIPSTKE